MLFLRLVYARRDKCFGIQCFELPVTWIIFIRRITGDLDHFYEYGSRHYGCRGNGRIWYLAHFTFENIISLYKHYETAWTLGNKEFIFNYTLSATH